ncbi:hypothetical protein [Solibacillus sp. FSL K6-4121]|uniref:hypothetical protein n=1 Tax=Solibacillus sp. FSL K6-4121 TaxID=2921505 RepID=UPI0030F652E3
MSRNSNKIIVKKARTVNKLQVNQQLRQKFLQEEFGSELHPDSANQIAEKRRSTEENQPVSERTAWN